MGKFANFSSSDDFFEMLESGALNDDLVRDYIGFKTNLKEKLVGFGYSLRQIEGFLERLSAILVNKKFSDGRNFLHYLIDSKAGVDAIAAFLEDVFTDSGISVDMPIATFSSIVSNGDDFGINAYDRSFGNDELRAMLVEENSCFEDHSHKARLVAGIISGGNHGALDKLTAKWSQFLDADFFNRFNDYLSKYLEPSPEGDEILQSWKRAIYFKLFREQPEKFFELVSSQDFDKSDLAMERVSKKNKKVPLFGLAVGSMPERFPVELFLDNCIKVPSELRNDQYFYNLRLCSYAIDARRGDLLHDIILRSQLSDLPGLESVVDKVSVADDELTFKRSKFLIEVKLANFIAMTSDINDPRYLQNNKVAICAIKMGATKLFMSALAGNSKIDYDSLRKLIEVSAKSISNNRNVNLCCDIICDLLVRSSCISDEAFFLPLCNDAKNLLSKEIGIFRKILNLDFGKILHIHGHGDSPSMGLLEILVMKEGVCEREKVEFLIDNGAEMKSPRSVFLYLAEKKSYELMALIADKFAAYRDDLVQVCAQNQISLLFSQSKKLLGMVDSHGEALWHRPDIDKGDVLSFGKFTSSRSKSFLRDSQFSAAGMAIYQDLLMIVKSGPFLIADERSVFLERLEMIFANKKLDLNHVYENCGGLKILEVAAVIGNDKFIDCAIKHCKVGKIELSKKYCVIRNLVAQTDSDRGYNMVLSSFKEVYKEEFAKGFMDPKELNFVNLAEVLSAVEGRGVKKMFTTKLNKSVEVDRADGAAEDIGAARASKPPSSQVTERGADVVAAALLEMQEGRQHF